MNQVFSFKRWSRLLGKHWAENSKRYLLALLAFMGLLLMWFVFLMFAEDHNPMSETAQKITFYVSLFFAGTIFSSQFFQEMGSKPKTINYLLTPASSFEKVLSSIFFVVVLFFIVFVAAFYLVDIVAVSLANSMHPFYAGGNKAEVVNVFSAGKVDGPPINYLLILFFALQSAFLLGSVYFSQYSFIKTAIVLSLLFLLVFLFEEQLMSRLMPNGMFYNGLNHYRVFIGNGEDRIVSLPDWVDSFLVALFSYGFTPILWIATYFRLKEKEV